jgi:hypothetical protein
VAIISQGFADKALLHPDPSRLARAQGVVRASERQAWRNSLCVTTANVTTPLVLRPGEQWAGLQRFRALGASG